MKETDRRRASALGSNPVPADLLAVLSASLAERRESLRRRLDLLEQELPSDVVDGPRDLGDAELVRAQFDTTRTHLIDVDAAIARIDAGTYGRCTGCEEPINLERLEALPDAALCVSCIGR
jgi:RNA polymerase-binding transcription factor DksA